MAQRAKKRAAKRAKKAKEPPAQQGKEIVRRLPAKRLKALEAALERDDSQALCDMDIALEHCIAPQAWDHGFGVLSEARAKFLASFYLTMEVDNGGFNQFLLNQGPEAVGPALAFLDERGPKEVAVMLRKAVRALPGGRLPADKREMLDILAGDHAPGIDRAHEKLDNEYFERNLDERMVRDRLEFVREHAGEFFR